MKRTKVALDCDIPEALAPMLDAAFNRRGFEFVPVGKIVPPRTADETWAPVFKRFGGEITLSADKNIIKKPHKALAFLQNGFKAFFMPPHWSNAPGQVKLAHLVYWWPEIAKHAVTCATGSCWQVPLDYRDGVLRLGPDEFKELKIPDDVLARSAAEIAAKAAPSEGSRGTPAAGRSA